MQMISFGKLFRSGSTLMLILALNLTAESVFAQGAESTSSFYQKSKEGWFWYHDPSPEQVEEEKLKPEQPAVTQQPVENRYRGVDLDQFSLADLWSMYPDDFQELLDHVQNLAVQDPSEKNVLRYQVIQDIARRKALAYTSSAMYVNQKYSNLFNVNQVYPTAKPGATARVQMQQQEIGQTIVNARSSYALIYFTSPTCGFCEKQNAILHYFIEKYGWTIKPVNISQQPTTAARFGIETTPTLLLIKKGMDDYMTISVGVVALTELERKLYRAIRYLGGQTRGNNFLMYDFEKGSAFDPASILNKKGNQPWQRNSSQ